MDEGTRQAFETRLRTNPRLAAEVAFWEDRLAALAEDVTAVVPPDRVLQGIEARLFPESQDARTGLWNSLAFWRGLGLASLAFALVIGLATVTGVLTPPAQGERLIATLAGETGAVRMAVVYDPRDGALRVNRVEGAAPEGRAFELWLIAGSEAPVSLGVLPAEARGTVSIPEALRAQLPNAVLAISDEPTGGSPTGQPTGAVLATGQMLTVS
jgi:anti-sigma-K factor RskA